MKINEIIKENLDLEVSHHGAANTQFDAYYNPEIYTNNMKQQERYAKLGMVDGNTPVFTKIPKNPANKPFTTKPTPDQMQSPGYRGKQMALARASLPNEPYAKVDPVYKNYDDVPGGPPSIYNGP